MQTLKVLFLLALVPVLFSSRKAANESSKTKWLTLAQVTDSLKSEKRPVLIDLYTDWCGWCKVMDKKTYANRNVGDYLSKKFYSVKVDAESKDQITWKGKTYSFNPQYRTNDFALYLTRGQLSYPTTIIIPTDGSEPQAIPGYLEPKDFEMIAKYFGEGHFGKISFDSYQRSFKSSW
ncbi:MAG: DUF255 domain-containing protein [Chitinophagaceae bacterium]|nr:DUF255 domain-containing protein [Chitinophagaceae bacterium]